MSTLATVREELVDAVKDLGLYTYTHLPGKAAFPSAIVLAGSPYIEEGQTFGERTVRLEMWLSVSQGTNGTETTALDDLIGQAILALESADWLIESVSQPFEFTSNNGQALTSAFTVTTPVTFTQGV